MRKRYKPYVLFAPFLILFLSVFLWGLVTGIIQSLGYMPNLHLNQWTFKYYGEVLKDKEFLSSLLYSIYISLVSSSLSVLLGVMAAFAVLGLKKENRLLTFIYRLPIIVPHLVAVVLIFHFFSQTGLISRIFYNAGIIHDPNQWPLVVFDNTGVGIILVYLYKQIPFITMTVFAVLKNINEEFSEAAYNLGASRLQALFLVVLPLIMPTVLSVFLIIFAFSFGAFEVPYLIGSPVISTLPVKAYLYYTSPDYSSRTYTMVINVLISLISIGLTWLYVKVYRFSARYVSKGE